MICNKKYHFLLPSNSGPGENGKSDWNIELHGDEGHKMHGVFHSNGFGHLLCINGSENGSDLLGYQIMEFWDRLCSKLGARSVYANLNYVDWILICMHILMYFINVVGK